MTLNAHGVGRIDTAAQAANALEPIAGSLAFALFAAGIIGTGLWQCPFWWDCRLCSGRALRLARGLRASRKRPGLDLVVAIATIGGVVLNFLHLDPLKAAFLVGRDQGIVSPPIMVVMMLLAAR